MTTDILKEIVEGDREKRSEKTIKSLIALTLGIGMIALIIAIFSGKSQVAVNRSAQDDSEKLIATVKKLSLADEKSVDAALGVLGEISKSERSAYSLISRLYIALIEYMRGNVTRGTIEYLSIADNPHYDRAIRQYFRISAITGELTSKIKQEKEAIQEIDTLIQDKSFPLWGSTALVQSVILSEIGDYKAAGLLLADIEGNSAIGVPRMNDLARKLKHYADYMAAKSAAKAASQQKQKSAKKSAK